MRWSDRAIGPTNAGEVEWQPNQSRSSSPLGTALAVMRTATDLATNASTALKVAQGIGSTIKTTRAAAALVVGSGQAGGVSKSVVSRIEAGLTSPTAVMLTKLAEGMTVSLSSLLRGDMSHRCIQQLAGQPIFRDPKSGLTRRTLSPVSPMHW